jgi:DNA polymerase III subunit gamma/tau
MAKRKPSSAETDENAAAKPPDYTVLARRYRPQQFSDLVGQEPVAQALINALQSNRVAHAYLFTGVRGVGKTSTARILAKALNCVKGPTATPCNECENCKAIAAGDDIDVVEIDGASNNSVDNIRDLRANVQFRPSRSRFKIYIIDEVHMLAKGGSAFPALLKTLEEPPPHVKFIFATTEVEKIPITILSRCQRFDFAGIGTPRIVERLRQIVASEGMQADADALALIARRAGGSMRDAQSLLDQLLAFGGERLTADEVHRLLGTAHDDRVTALASAVLDHDAKTALEALGQAANAGLQLGEFLDQLIEYWRDLMVVHCAAGADLVLSVTGAHAEVLKGRAANIKLDTILAGLDVLVTTKSRLRTSNHGRVLLEMALVRLSRLDDLVSLSQLAQWLKQGEGLPGPQRGPARVASSPSAAVLSRPPEAALPPEGVKKKPANGTDKPSALGPTALTAENLPQLWSQVLAQVGPMLKSKLERAQSVAISGPNTLVLRFPAGYNDEREHCQAPNSVQKTEEALRRLTGQAYSLRIESGGGGTEPAAGPAQDGSSTETGLARARRSRDEAMELPLLKRARDLMGAQVLRVDDGFGSAALNKDEPAIDVEES